MEQDRLQNILKELYELDPSLRSHGDKLNVLIQKLLESEPEAEADSRFVAKLRHELMEYKPKKLFLFNFSMNKVPLAIATGVSVVAIIFTASVYMNVSSLKSTKIKQYAAGQLSGEQKLVVLDKNAFGSLSFSGISGTNESALAAPSAAPMAQSNLTTTDAVASKTVAFGRGGGGVAASSAMIAEGQVAGKMIAPYYNYLYNYNYVGDDFVIENAEMPVYRLAVNSDTAKSVAGSILNTSLGFVDLSGLANMSVGSISLSQGKEGYNVYMNFDQGRVSIDRIQNYNYPPLYKTMIACDGPGCERPNYEEPKYEQVADNVLIDATENFINKFRIDKSAYGKPFVDNSWKKYNYDASYVPRYQSVVYPLAFDGKEAVESNGYAAGMRFNVDLADVAVQGVWEIINPVFEQSNYTLETDFARILKIAQKGGINGMFYIYGAQAEGESLDLGTPEYVYMHQYDYADGYTFARELYFPALKFPIINVPEGKQIYQDYVIIPLVKEVLDTYDKQDSVGILPEPVPMPYITPEQGSTEPGVVEGSAGSDTSSAETPLIR